MKTIISLVAVGFSLISLTGCYTHLVTVDHSDEIYKEPETTIIVIPTPQPPVEPCLCAEPPEPPPPYNPSPPVQHPDPPKEKYRKPEINKSTRPNNDGSVRDELRGSGSRNNSDKRNR